MRPLLKHLPLLLTLLIPLGLLAWFGSRELVRLEERSQTVYRDEAHRFLKNEELKVRDEIERFAYQSLSEGIGGFLADPTLSLVEASQQLEKESYIQKLFVTDADFNLIGPRAPKVESPSAPLHRFPAAQDNDDRELFRANFLMDVGDTEGAIECLESYLDAHEGSRDHWEGAAWAAFHLGALYDKTPDRSESEEVWLLYNDAQWTAEDIFRKKAPNEDAAAIILLSELRRARTSEELVGFLERVCTDPDNYFRDYLDYVADDFLDWIVHYVAELIPPEHQVERMDSLDLHQVRASGRRFALDYDDHARRELQLRRARQGSRQYSYRGVLFHALATARGAGLLVLRPADATEKTRFEELDEKAAWVGLLLDLQGLVVRGLSITPTSAPDNVALAVNDPNGVALLPDQAVAPGSAATEIDLAPVTSLLAGLEFVAIPLTDATEIRSAARNQLILGLILVVVAAGGAFMLIRSVRRETELANTKVLLLSRVSHELKTPLAVIKMYGETLGLGRTTDQGQVGRFAGIISSEADRLTHMVERILDFSKMEAGTFTYDKEPLDLGEIVETVTSEYLPHVEARGLDLIGEIRHDLQAFVDPRGLASSLVNLLENALKYTPATSTSNELEVALEQQNGDAVLEVRDRGVGIPDGEHDKVFSDFYRASNASEVRGAGLGLSLVDHFAQAHDGTVEALPREGGGTIMRLTLPLAPTDPADTTPTTATT